MAYRPTSLGISVLALLLVRPMHAYEMLQTLVGRAGARQWRAAARSDSIVESRSEVGK